MTLNGIRWPKYYLTATGAVFAGTIATASQASLTHHIKPGDNLSSIARKYHVSVKDIVIANHLPNQDALPGGRALIIPPPPKHVTQKTTMHRAATIHGDRISVRMGPGLNERRVDMFDMGVPLIVTAEHAEWYQVALADGRNGWVRKDFVKLAGHAAPVVATKSLLKKHHAVAKIVVKPAHKSIKLAHIEVHHSKTGSKHVAIHTPKHVVGHKVAHSKIQAHHSVRQHFAAVSHSSHRKRHSGHTHVQLASNLTSSSDVVRTAIAYRGTPYHYGGTGRSGFDCSGFTSYIYRQKGVALPHSAAGQFGHGTQVSKADMKPGDLVFFHCGRKGISHVGIYAGNGKFVHSSSPHSGGVRVDSLNDRYYKSKFRGARRVK